MNYATGTATSKTGLINMYIHGGTLLSVLTLLVGLVSTGTVDAAIQVWWQLALLKSSSSDIFLPETASQ
ncbi:hypothetical protein ACFPM1_15200 [Halorubrum rubrum]|uniref:Uncharacterized protein n=1 Tax=Halorubrum rubrum TaxID=1126240 RepID=A0ABD5R5F6_9EURY|nr:hypothetical protein [Halorubrum rubrum]